ncbi:MAG: hypothetical protein H0W08_04715 [Acidobacteria bacterium]|nr:hypothetical protein [Acidobacteriota bacterium]
MRVCSTLDQGDLESSRNTAARLVRDEGDVLARLNTETYLDGVASARSKIIWNDTKKHP